jgi:hypothetical protein
VVNRLNAIKPRFRWHNGSLFQQTLTDKNQYFVSGFHQVSGSVPRSWFGIRTRIRNPDPGGQKWPTKTEKNLRNFIFWSAGCSLLRAEGFFCSLDILLGGLGIGKLDRINDFKTQNRPVGTWAWVWPQVPSRPPYLPIFHTVSHIQYFIYQRDRKRI